MIPYHQLIGAEDAPHLAFVLHGVLGAGHNFRSFVKRLSKRRPEYRFALLDLRYHGRSVGAPPPHTLEACADDLFDLTSHLGTPPRVVIGHSLGGKAALAFGRRHLDEVQGHRIADDVAHETLKQIWALDSDPGAQQARSTHQVVRVLSALLHNRGPFGSRAEAIQSIINAGMTSALANWLATNLKRERAAEGESFSWMLELEQIDELIEDYFQLDLWPLLEDVAYGRPPAPTPRFDLLVAEDSDRWSGNMKEHAEALPSTGAFHLHHLPNSGHWVHVDNPSGLLDILAEHLV